MLTVFSVISIAAIVAGGCVAAFSAKRPTTFKVWLSAYLVLVVGVVQFGLVTARQQIGQPGIDLASLAFGLYNMGSLGVIVGTGLKHRNKSALSLVRLGGASLAAAMLLLAWSVHTAEPSWTLIWFACLILVILVAMPIGLILASRRHSRS